MEAFAVPTHRQLPAEVIPVSGSKRLANLSQRCQINIGFPRRISVRNLNALRRPDLYLQSSPGREDKERAYQTRALPGHLKCRATCMDDEKSRYKKPFLGRHSQQVQLLAWSGLAVGLAFSICTPVLAGSIVSSQRTLTAPTQTVTKKDETPADRDKNSEAKDVAEDEAYAAESLGTALVEKTDETGTDFEPPFGEGSDLTTDAAEIMFRSYLERHPNDVKALQALLFFRMKKGEVSSAISLLDRLVEIEPKNLEWKYMRAQTLDFAGDLDLSEKGFKEILEIEPFSARAYQGLAVVMQKNRQDSLVLEMLEGAIKQATESKKLEESRNLRMLLGQMHTLQGNLKEALQQYNVILKDDPNDFRPYLCKGLIYSILGMSKEAEQFFRHYRKLCPKDFPNRGYLDELMLQAKTESRKLKERKEKEAEDKAKGKKPVKPMKQPTSSGVDKKDSHGQLEEETED